MATFGLLAVIWGCARLRESAVPFAVAAYITAAYWFTASTSFANPAVTLARSASDTFAGIRPLDVPAFIAAQLVGAAAATALFAWLVPVARGRRLAPPPTARARVERGRPERGPGASAPRRHYGWVIVATLCVTETITWGIIFYGFPVFLSAMEEDLGASRVVVTGAFSLGLGVAALAGIPVGRWLDRRGARLLMTWAPVSPPSLTFLWSLVETPAALYAVWL